MKKATPAPIDAISALHRILGLPSPLHPLISMIDNTKIAVGTDQLPDSFLLSFFKISFKKLLKGRMGYGQGYYDYDEGGLVFTAPHQIISIEKESEFFGATLLIHPDFIRNYPLGKNIKNYGFFFL